MPPFPLDLPAFRPVAVAFVPELAAAEARVWSALEVTVATALGARDPGLTDQVRTFIRIIDLFARLRYGRPATRLETGQLARLLASLERAPFQLIRRGVWGLRTLVLMGYYTQPAVIAGLGYRADRAGWAARG